MVVWSTYILVLRVVVLQASGVLVVYCFGIVCFENKIWCVRIIWMIFFQGINILAFSRKSSRLLVKSFCATALGDIKK